MAYENLSREELISFLERLTGDVATDPLANVGGASVVPPPDSMYQSYNPAGAYAEAGRTVPNRVSERAMAMNQLTQPQGGVPSDLHNWNDPYGRSDDTPFYEGQIPYFGTDPNLARAMREGILPSGYDYGSLPSGEEVIDMATGLRPVGDASVVRPIGETIDNVMRQPEQGRAPIGDPEPYIVASEQDLMFHKIQKEIRRGEEPEAPQWMIDMVRAVPEEDWAALNQYDNEGLQAFHQKHGFPPSVGR